MNKFITALTIALVTSASPLSSVPAAAQDMPLLSADLNTGRIKTAGNDDVRLFGVNYLGGMYQYYQIDNYVFRKPPPKRSLFADLGIAANQVKGAIDRDLDQMELMGVDLLRIHVLMGDIANDLGNLRTESQELDWFDYLIAGAIKRKMYVHLTPITPWEHFVTLEGRFSDRSWNEPNYTQNLSLIKLSSGFVKKLMLHRNKYLDNNKGRSIAAEPGIGMIELINEPKYVYDRTGAYSNDIPGQSLRFLRDDLMNKMIADVRAAEDAAPGGVRHMVGWSTFGVDKTYELQQGNFYTERKSDRNPNVAKAIIESNAQFLGRSGYTDEWFLTYPFVTADSKEPFKAVNYVGGYPEVNLNKPGQKRPNIAYEWDLPGSQMSYYLPNMAAAMRANDVKAASMFQYDLTLDANKNSIWSRHYLNWLYSPERTVSFMIAGEVFRNKTAPSTYRDANQNSFGGDLQAYTSHAEDLALYNDNRVLMHNRTIPREIWPSARADNLRKIVSVGSSPYATYTGSGIYSLTVVDPGKQINLNINPDVEKRNRTVALADGKNVSTNATTDPASYTWWATSEIGAVRKLSQVNGRRFELRWPGIRPAIASVFRIDPSNKFVRIDHTAIQDPASGIAFNVSVNFDDRTSETASRAQPGRYAVFLN